LNRGAVEEVEFDHSHISGGLSKIQTADNVFGIFTSRAMRERGKYQIQLMKTRSSSGVGMKIDLDFDVDTLRITSSDEQSDDQPSESRSSNILNTIARKSSIDSSTGEIRADDPTEGMIVKQSAVKVESTKLRQLLNNLPDV
jgi:hypothetical protein